MPLKKPAASRRFFISHINRIRKDHDFTAEDPLVTNRRCNGLANMFSFFSGQPQAPQRVPTDLVVPVGFFDDTIIFRTFVLYTLFVFDDVLDPEKLRTSLERVVNRPGWKKLGARLRKNVRNKPC